MAGRFFLSCVWRGTCSALVCGGAACYYPSSRRALAELAAGRAAPGVPYSLLLSAGLAFFAYRSVELGATVGGKVPAALVEEGTLPLALPADGSQGRGVPGMSSLAVASAARLRPPRRPGPSFSSSRRQLDLARRALRVCLLSVACPRRRRARLRPARAARPAAARGRRAPRRRRRPPHRTRRHRRRRGWSEVPSALFDATASSARPVAPGAQAAPQLRTSAMHTSRRGLAPRRRHRPSRGPRCRLLPQSG